jgi:hypothetical protein
VSKDIMKKENGEIVKSRTAKDIEVLKPVHRASPFISFHYSCKEISSDGVNTHIRSTEKSFANGKLKSEEFEGTLPGNVYTSMVGEMQTLFLDQLKTFMKPFSIFLPPGSKNRDK